MKVVRMTSPELQLVDIADPADLNENFRVLEERLGPPTGQTVTGLEVLARLLRGVFIETDLPASTAEDAAEDVAVEHGLGRMPKAVVIAVATDGLGGQVLASPDGLQGAAGANHGAWTTEEIRLRASRAANYEMVVA